MWGRLRQRPIASSAFATAIAAIAVLAIAQVTKGDAVSRAFYDVDPGWIALLAVAGFIVYPAYVLAYRSIACIHGHAPLELPLVARVVVAGFGPFAIGGGFGIDKQALHALHEDERSARVRVLALGTLEWAVLAPVACGVSIALLAMGAKIEGALLWPWAIAVPFGFGFALWASTPDRLRRLRGKRFERLMPLLEGVGVLHTLIRDPRRYAGAWIGTTLYWAADIAAFYGALRAFGLQPSAEKVILAYATGYVATRRSLPLGGAGITEALMIYSLHWLGAPLAPALAAVVAYRAFNFLLVATPALIARRQMQPLLDRADRLRRRERRERRERAARSAPR
jgi:uncharacterized membrane protein YbhN (UPF0104 family)